MDFKLSDQQKELQMTARNFAKKEMSEVADHMEHTSEPLSKDWLKKYSEMGFLGINVDEKYGGSCPQFGMRDNFGACFKSKSQGEAILGRDGQWYTVFNRISNISNGSTSELVRVR